MSRCQVCGGVARRPVRYDRVESVCLQHVDAVEICDECGEAKENVTGAGGSRRTCPECQQSEGQTALGEWGPA